MRFYRVQLEQRDDLIGVSSIISVYDEEGEDVSAEFEKLAANKGHDLQGRHLIGHDEAEVLEQVRRFLAEILGLFPRDVSVELE